jgi:hypothetical protein
LTNPSAAAGTAKGKRGELMRDITVARDRIAMLEADLASVEGAIRVFDPDSILPEKGKRVPALNAAPFGHMTRHIMDCLRGGQAKLTGEVTSYVMECRHLDPAYKRLWFFMRNRTSAALGRLRRKGFIRSETGPDG